MLLLLAYAPAWGIAHAVKPVYRAVVSAGASQYYAAQSKPIRFDASGPEILFRSGGRRGFSGSFSASPIDSNLAFLLTLLLVTPGIRLRGRAVKVAIGTLWLLLAHVLFLVSKAEVSLIGAAHPLAGSPILWQTLDNFFEIVGKVFFPILIWLGLTLPYMMGAVDESKGDAALSRPVARNAPCPCGSGKKYKLCCGGSPSPARG